MAGATKLMTAGGGGVNITPASSISSDVTVQVPSQNCTLDIQGPAFSAYRGTNQSVTNSTWTKAQLDTENFDTNSNFDSATNYRFTPTVAGYYQINAGIYVNNSGGSTAALISIYKNGTVYKLSGLSASSMGSGGVFVSDVIYFNGSTDYVELYGFNTASSAPIFQGGQDRTFLSGVLVRAA